MRYTVGSARDRTVFLRNKLSIVYSLVFEKFSKMGKNRKNIESLSVSKVGKVMTDFAQVFIRSAYWLNLDFKTFPTLLRRP